ncbi:MAG: hypothetical protein KJ850_11125 [Gammaproteobacteria bacterium]|nr:hypothetical protein [Gammaproteobacteria bacterium]MBU1625581.1 hypothetical protein [Gammaproteobacteria bacterium]MBU1980841.1 hypothetical protein [Gammaproteobacteria bacterium]
MFKLFGEKPDHPLFDLVETKRLIGELPKDEPRKALEEISFWLESIKDAKGFTPELRTEIIMHVDEFGQVLQAELLHRYLEAPHLRDFQGLHLWKGIHAFAHALADAYTTSLDEYQQNSKRSRELTERMPLVCVRQLQAVATQMKLELMRYIDIDATTWNMLYAGYRFAEATQCAETMVLAYPGHVIHTSPQRELLHALVMFISSPDTLAADQLEVSYRIAGRMNSFFEIANAAENDFPYQFDLASSAPPHRAEHDKPVAETGRFFSAAKAVGALQKIVTQNENDPIWRERRFGSEFTPAGKLTVLKHLMTYWAAEPPHRHLERREIHASIEVAHSFRTISQLVTHIDAGHDAEQDADEARKRAKIDLVAQEEIAYTTETWNVTDMSATGLGAILGGTQGEWIKIGDLCAIKPANAQQWWVGMIRRLHTDNAGKVHVGIELLTKKPASVWIRVLGKGAERVSNWESSSGSFAYDYLPVILLPDEHNSYVHATLLMESGKFVVDTHHQMMMGEKSRDIKLTALLAEGEDFEQAGFEWLGAD